MLLIMSIILGLLEPGVKGKGCLEGAIWKEGSARQHGNIVIVVFSYLENKISEV